MPPLCSIGSRRSTCRLSHGILLLISSILATGGNRLLLLKGADAFGVTSVNSNNSRRSLPRSSTTSLNYQNNIDDENLPLHQTVMTLDPNWYQEYVVDILGKDFCKATWPVEPKKNVETKEDPITTEDLVDDMDKSKADLESLKEVSSKATETELKADITKEPVVAAEGDAGEKVEAVHVEEQQQTKMVMEAVVDKELEKPVISVDATEEDDTPMELPVDANKNEKSRNGEGDNKPKSSSPERKKGSVDSFIESTWKGMTQGVLGGDGGVTKEAKFEEAKPVRKSPEPLQEPPFEAAVVTEEESGETTSDTLKEPPKTVTSGDSKRVPQDERMVVYQSLGGDFESYPLASLLEMGYEPKEIENMQSDALAVIVEDQVKRPRFGVPPQWKRQSGQESKIRLLSKSEAASFLDDTNLKQPTTKNTATPTRRQRRQERVAPKTTKQGMKNEPTFKRTEPATSEAAKAAPVPDNIPSSSFTTTKPNTSTTDDGRFVVYRNLDRVLTSTPLQSLTKLGYQPGEIEFMESDALAVVIDDAVSRPRIGVPSQWKIKRGAAPQVRIVDDVDAARAVIQDDSTATRRKKTVENESIVGKPRQRRSPRKQAAKDDYGDEYDRRRGSVEERRISRREEASRGAMATDVGSGPRDPRIKFDDELPEESERESATVDESRRQRRQQERGYSTDSEEPVLGEDTGVDEKWERKATSTEGTRWHNDAAADDSGRKSEGSSRRRRRERNNLNPDGTPKKIYNARERAQPLARADPPPLNSKVWVDMDKFRELLRTEAGLRLKILGDDWAPTVKQESDWRLNLYKEWLWTLHNGVGDSIVPPSRYERARKMRTRMEEDEAIRRPRPRRRKEATASSSSPRKTRRRSETDY